MRVRPLAVAFVTAVLLSVRATAAQGVQAVDLAAIDAIFESFSGTDVPGCAVGVSYAGQTLVERAYGMADLEHDVANRPETVFEPGSVAKQFTAAATILLALEGKLSLDDDIRTYIPELPTYEAPVTIRHLIHHTSGLRDWGSIAAIEGWPRTTRAHTHAHMLGIASRQQELNHLPGEHYSYTNTGYNLQAVLVERVSGMTFAEFSTTRLFEPLSMMHTEWRDDYTRIVKNRSVAYVPTDDSDWHMLMPFESVYGNGGLLTTVGDLLRWTRNLNTGVLGGDAFLVAMHREGVLNSGQTIPYAGGLRVGTYRGLPEVWHGGATAGYRGFLTRFPEQGLAVALMCNAASADTGRLSHRVADLFLDEGGSDQVAAIDLPQEQLEARAGGYQDMRTGAFTSVVAVDDGLRVQGVLLLPVAVDRFEATGGVVLEFGEGQSFATLKTPATTVSLEPVDNFIPTAEELTAYTGTYWSDEAEATYVVDVDGDRLVMQNRYGSRTELAPAYLDVFTSGGTTYIFQRDGSAQVNEMRLTQGRVWGLQFERLP
jgi:CubicO group peptidase (beta-lactamase class C family)